jgi:hypothetical protein
MTRTATSLEQMLQQLCGAAKGERVSVDDMLGAVGRRSFGPLILLAGLVTLSPIGDVPGTPTLVALLVLLISTQLLWGRSTFWLPGWILRRSVARTTMTKSVGWLERPTRFIDRFLRPRLALFVEGFAVRVIAVVTLLVSLAMPIMEVIPFSASGAGGALTAFGLALIAHDGLMALLALVVTVGTGAPILYHVI